MQINDIPESIIVHPGELTEHPANSNNHDKKNLAELAESRRQFGQYKNIIVWEAPEEITVEVNNETHVLKPGIKYVIAGNGFHQASILRGDDAIEVKDYSHLTYDQALLLMETDNASPLGSERNAQQMAANLERARALYIDNEHMNRMLGRAKELVGINGRQPDAGRDTEPQIDQAAVLREKWQTEAGQLWQLGRHRLICGDCTDEAVVEQILDIHCHMMVTDPPYGVEYDPNWRNEAAEAGLLAYAARRVRQIDNDDRIDWSDAYLLFPGDVAYTWSPGGDHVILTGIAIQKAGFEIRNQIIWQKPHFPISRGHYTYQHEPLWYAVRKGKKANWIGDANSSTMWRISLDRNVEGGHSTQKPLECMAKPIGNHTGDVYDPFLGSGTTIIACENLARHCRAVEIDPAYVAVTLERWHKHSGQMPELISK